MALCASMPVAVGADPPRFYTASTRNGRRQCPLRRRSAKVRFQVSRRYRGSIRRTPLMHLLI